MMVTASGTPRLELKYPTMRPPARSIEPHLDEQTTLQAATPRSTGSVRSPSAARWIATTMTRKSQLVAGVRKVSVRSRMPVWLRSMDPVAGSAISEAPARAIEAPSVTMNDGAPSDDDRRLWITPKAAPARMATRTANQTFIPPVHHESAGKRRP